MPRQHEPVVFDPELQQREAKQRRRLQIEARTPIPIEPFREPCLPRVGCKVADVHFRHGHFHCAWNHLQRRAHAFVDEARAQARMPGDQRLHRRAQRLWIDDGVDLEDELAGIDVWRVLVE